MAEGLDELALTRAKLPVPFEEEIRDAASRGKLEVEIEPHGIHGFAEIGPVAVQCAEFVKAIMPSTVEGFTRLAVLMVKFPLDEAL